MQATTRERLKESNLTYEKDVTLRQKGDHPVAHLVEFVFGEDEALTWYTVASASGVNDPRHYTRRNASASTSRTLYDESDEDLVEEDDIVDLENDEEIRNENLDDQSK
ncbi:hypothetical protein Tco_1343347 [Tanacetum coccineum]